MTAAATATSRYMFRSFTWVYDLTNEDLVEFYFMNEFSKNTYEDAGLARTTHHHTYLIHTILTFYYPFFSDENDHISEFYTMRIWHIHIT